jgi:hypothetical protein
METLKEAKSYLKANWGKGVECPCCGQFVKLYKRTLNSGMAVTLIRIYNLTEHIDLNLPPVIWIDVKDFLRQKRYHNGHDWTLLRFWGLLEQQVSEDNPEQKHSGFWKITEKGKDFVKNKIIVPKQLLHFNQTPYGFVGKEITITDALGSKFNYQELMDGL